MLVLEKKSESGEKGVGKTDDRVFDARNRLMVVWMKKLGAW
jgi:hypothetical protein